MESIEKIAEQIQSIGFHCSKCGACCSAVEMDSNLVMVTPDEIRQVSDAYDLSWQDIAEPYPEKIHDKAGHVYTFGWCIHRENTNCHFLKNGGCEIYQTRPWICRTYPFVLSDESVHVSPCPGLGSAISWDDALMLAKDLIARKMSESRDEEQVRSVFQNAQIPAGRFVVIDGDGIKNTETLYFQ